MGGRDRNRERQEAFGEVINRKLPQNPRSRREHGTMEEPKEEKALANADIWGTVVPAEAAAIDTWNATKPLNCFK